MSQQGRCFPYEKNIVINALYDTIEALGLKLESSNSSRGTMIVSNANKETMRIALSIGKDINQTQVDIYPGDASMSFAKEWGFAVLDEIAARIRQVYENG